MSFTHVWASIWPTGCVHLVSSDDLWTLVNQGNPNCNLDALLLSADSLIVHYNDQTLSGLDRLLQLNHHLRCIQHYFKSNSKSYYCHSIHCTFLSLLDSYLCFITPNPLQCFSPLCFFKYPIFQLIQHIKLTFHSHNWWHIHTSGCRPVNSSISVPAGL